MPRTRQQNVTAAQWSANGAALGSPDLTLPGNQVFAANVFSPAVQRQRLPKHVYKALQRTLAHGEALDTSLADAVALAMKDWAMEKGATHYTHWFQPLTGVDRREARLLLRARRRRHRDRRVLRQRADPGRARRVLVPHRRHPRDVRGPRLHRVGPDLPGVHPREPQRRAAVHPDGVHVLDRRGARPQDPAAALDGRAVRRGDPGAGAARRSRSAKRVFTTVGPEQEYFLIDEQYYFERPDLVTTGRTLFGAKPPKGHELDDHYFGSIPERILACMLETEHGARQARRADQDAPQRGRAEPVRDRADLRELERRLRPPAADDAGDAERRAPLRPRVPAAREAVRGRERLGQAQQLVDGHRHRREPARAGRHAVGEPPVPVLLRGGDPGGQHPPGAAARVDRERRARTTASAPTRRRRRSSRSSSARSWKRCSRRSSRAKANASKPGSFLGLGTPVLPPLPLHGGDRNRTSPFAFTGNKFEFRALGSSQSLAMPNTVLNTIVAEAIDDLAGKLKTALKGSRREPREGGRESRSATATAANKRIIFDGDNYAPEWHEEAEKRGLVQPALDPRSAAVARRQKHGRAVQEVQRALKARARVALRGLPRAVRGQDQHRGGDRR